MNPMNPRKRLEIMRLAQETARKECERQRRVDRELAASKAREGVRPPLRGIVTGSHQGVLMVHLVTVAADVPVGTRVVVEIGEAS